MSIFKFTNTVDGDEDPVFVDAADEATALATFSQVVGHMPRSMLKIEQLGQLPAGEETIN